MEFLVPVSLEKESDWLCLAQVARELVVTRATVTNWHQRHDDFPEITAIGSMRYVKRQELYDWLDKHDRWYDIRLAHARQAPKERKPRVRSDVDEIRRLIAKHEAALLRLNRELQRAERAEVV
ncbi:hypothetical protein [Streptomyces sp. NPDC044948]|uniref:hypothetical protein n=1 Tax=Streptomyces sp. NPDC044948 TaxID=3157092 RepID=UPI0033D56349